MSVTGPPGLGTVAGRHRGLRHRRRHAAHAGRARRAARARPHRARAMGAHLAARGDGQLHGLPGHALADRRRGAAARRATSTRPWCRWARTRPPTATSTSPRMGDFAALLRAASTLPSSPTTRATPTSRRASSTAPSSTPTSRASLRTRTTAEWVDRLADVVPCGPVLAVDEVFADPQVEHLGLTQRVAHPTRGEVDVLRPPLTFSDTPARIRSGPPADGAHTRDGAGRARVRRRPRSTSCTPSRVAVGIHEREQR